MSSSFSIFGEVFEACVRRRVTYRAPVLSTSLTAAAYLGTIGVTRGYLSVEEFLLVNTASLMIFPGLKSAAATALALVGSETTTPAAREAATSIRVKTDAGAFFLAGFMKVLIARWSLFVLRAQ